MTVQQLIDLLNECDPEAEVRIMSQEGWPFENALKGIAVREDFGSEECECDHRITEPHDEDCPAGGDGEHEDGLKANDVFLVEGAQERYGDKAAWEVVRGPW
jgi:hypothetical protein